jgi:hypothetical protein
LPQEFRAAVHTIQKIESDQALKKNAALARASQRLFQSFTIDPLGSPVDD